MRAMTPPSTPFRAVIAILLCALAMASGFVRPAGAAQSPWAEEAQSAVRLVAAQESIGAAGTVRAGLEFRMKPHWKVYWRSPGDAGFPPDPKWDASDNAAVGPMEWPVPERFSVLGLETLGYEDAVIMPFTARIANPTKPATIAAHVRYLACNDICIPFDATVSMTIPPGDGRPSAHAHSIGRFASLVPRQGADAHMRVRALRLQATAKALYLIADANADVAFAQPDLFVEGPAGLGYGKPDVSLAADGRSATLRVGVSGFDGTAAAAAEKLAGTSFTLTLRDGRSAVEAAVTASVAPASGAPVGNGASILAILALAYLGGLILNLMPCVLPVLSIKLLSLVKHGGGERARVRAGFLASAAGVVSAFMVLAGGLIAFKGAGAAIGWGIQFQQGWFLAGMAVLVTLFACNMWGFFEFRLPGALADKAMAGHGVGGIAGHFLQGAFATLLATPCSAPFLGTAVGFALARGPAEIAAVFAFLGFGLATPYLAVAAFPALATRMPKPGPWMPRFKFVLGLALAATAIWLLSVIAGVAGWNAAAAIGGLLVLTAIWMGPVMHRMPELRRATPILLTVVSVLAVGAPYVGDLNGPPDPATPAAPTAGKIAWKPFDRAALDAVVAGGGTVLVDVTADWCITCQVNKTLVLERGRLADILGRGEVTAMRADWTRPDPDIAAYLASFGRYGIPFNAVYGPNAKDGIALPELLSESVVLDALVRASSTAVAARFR